MKANLTSEQKETIKNLESKFMEINNSLSISESSFLDISGIKDKATLDAFGGKIQPKFIINPLDYLIDG